MPVISVITPMGRPLPALWERTAASVERAGSTLTDGWELQWCIHADGVDPGLIRDQPWWSGMESRITLTSSGRSGFAGARNKALTSVDGDVIGMCDDDDELGSGWVQLLSTLLKTGCAWVAGATEDIDGEGVVLRAPALAAGPMGPGAVNDMFLANGAWPWHGCAAIAQTAEIRAVGGWADLPWCEDLSMWAAVTEAAAGTHIGTVVYRLRQHADRSTLSTTREEHLNASLESVRGRIVGMRERGSLGAI